MTVRCHRFRREQGRRLPGQAARLGVLAVLLGTSWALLAQTASDAPSPKPDPNALTDAIAALGGGHLQSIKYAGTGTIGVGSEPIPAADAPGRTVRSFEVSIDYPASAMQVDLAADAASPAAVTAAAGQAHHIEAINGTVAWDMAVAIAPDVPGHKKAHGKTADVPAVSIAEPPRLNAAASPIRRQAIWITPHGFLKAALANQPALRPAGAGTEVSFYAGSNRYVGFLNSKHQVERVRTWVRQPDRADVLLDVTYTDYAVFGSVSFPTRIRQLQNGQLMLDVTITTVQPNVPVRVPVPAGLGAS